MKLTDAEIEEGARRLYTATRDAHEAMPDWPQLEPKRQRAYREIVNNLALALGGDRSPEAVEVFLIWMGDRPAP